MDKIGSLDPGNRYKKSSNNKKSVRKNESSPAVFESIVESETLTANAVQGIDSFDEDSDLEDLLDDVHQWGEKLVKFPSIKSVEAYKNSVRNFIHYVLQQAIKVESIEGAKFNRFKPSNKQKRYTLISVIDDKLDKLAAGILMNQGKQLDLLAKVEEINGLLVDLTS
ncbi:MAG TPA: DUF327 domain-containing protein [Spirochaeta sp.]|nr:DUF327 domain-containing protein [Spirochaeta sp.]